MHAPLLPHAASWSSGCGGHEQHCRGSRLQLQPHVNHLPSHILWVHAHTLSPAQAEFEATLLGLVPEEFPGLEVYLPQFEEQPLLPLPPEEAAAGVPCGLLPPCLAPGHVVAMPEGLYTGGDGLIAHLPLCDSWSAAAVCAQAPPVWGVSIDALLQPQELGLRDSTAMEAPGSGTLRTLAARQADMSVVAWWRGHRAEPLSYCTHEPPPALPPLRGDGTLVSPHNTPHGCSLTAPGAAHTLAKAVQADAEPAQPHPTEAAIIAAESKARKEREDAIEAALRAAGHGVG